MPVGWCGPTAFAAVAPGRPRAGMPWGHRVQASVSPSTNTTSTGAGDEPVRPLPVGVAGPALLLVSGRPLALALLRGDPPPDAALVAVAVEIGDADLPVPVLAAQAGQEPGGKLPGPGEPLHRDRGEGPPR